jgi:hypothetical protein
MSKSRSTQKRRPINIEESAMKMLTIFYTLLNKKEKTELKKEIKDIGTKSTGEIVNKMNSLIGNQQGGAASIIGASSNSIIKIVLLLVCLLYINTRVGASIESPMIFEKLELINKKGDKKSLNLDHSQVWKDTMSVMGTSTDVKRIYTEVDDILIKGKWTGLQAIYPGEAAKYEPVYNLYEADGCMISESINAPYRIGLDPKEVIPKFYNQFTVLKDAGVLSNADVDKLGKIATSLILEIPKNELTQKVVCNMQRHTMISLMAQDVSNRMAKETQAGIAAEPKFTEPNSKAEVNGMFKQIIDYFAGSVFVIVLLGFFGLGYSILNRKRGKSRTVKVENKRKNNKSINVEPKTVNGLEMLQKAYGSSSSDEEENAPVQAPIQPRVEAPSRAHITADVKSFDAQQLGLPIQFGTTKGNRSVSRPRNKEINK